MPEITFGEIYKEFCEWSPEHAAMVTDYRPWGKLSIVVWFNNGMAFKVKRHAPDKFTMQAVSKDDIDKKFGPNK